MAFWCTFVMRVFILFFWDFSLFNWSLECSCTMPLTPVVMVNKGVAFPSFVLYSID